MPNKYNNYFYPEQLAIRQRAEIYTLKNKDMFGGNNLITFFTGLHKIYLIKYKF